jgi:hypothetical protein
MIYTHDRAKNPDQPFHNLCGKRNFRQQIEDLPAFIEVFTDKGKINFCFTASGYAMEQRCILCGQLTR